MKNLQKLFFTAGMMMVVACLLLAGCTKEGPAGKDGTNGVDGLNGLNGVDGMDGQPGTAVCIVCHTVANFDTKIAEYHFSKHFTGNTVARNGKFCAKCHTSDGFLETQASGAVRTANDIPAAQRINCKTCHAHAGFDFLGDTVSEVLTNNKPVDLLYNKGTVGAVDFGAINNLCVSCHQIRMQTALVYSDTTLNPDVLNQPFDQLPFFPYTDAINDNDTVQFRAGRSFRVHDGNQSNLFAGMNGYEYDGKTYTREWYHSDLSCTDCHMNTYNPADSTGGHTLWVNEEECNACHGDNGEKIAAVQTLINGLKIQLAEKLTDRKVFKKTTNAQGVVSYTALETHDFNGKLYANDGGIYATSVSNNTVSPTTGLVIYGNMLKYAADANNGLRIGRPWKWGELGAAACFNYIDLELSQGVHNKNYAMQLLQNSIEWLDANP